MRGSEEEALQYIIAGEMVNSYSLYRGQYLTYNAQPPLKSAKNATSSNSSHVQNGTWV